MSTQAFDFAHLVAAIRQTHVVLANQAAKAVNISLTLRNWFIGQHIADTVKRWDAQQLSTLIEAHIGKDLQYIRINGTLVGGAIGLLLFLLSHAGSLWRSAMQALG